MAVTRRYTLKGDFYWDEASQSWHPSDFTRCQPWQIEIVRDWFRPNRAGVSEFVSIEELKAAFPDKAPALGGCGSDFFTRGLISKNFVFNDTEAIITDPRNGRVTHRRSLGLVDVEPVNMEIRHEIRKAIARLPCVMTGTRHRVEVDHKPGRMSPEDRERFKAGNQSIDDFQPLCAVGNLIKREACSKCKQSGRRFDARTIGYSVAWVEGGRAWIGTCKGCYWYDIIAFRRALGSATQTGESRS